MRLPFQKIIIIYNPNSTGDSHENARNLKVQLKSRLTDRVEVNLQATKHAGHAEELAIQYAKQGKDILLISSSGDGGYNEAVNGALASRTSQLTLAVMPSGNANDHYHATATADFVERIVSGGTRLIDVIDIRSTRDGRPWQRYAHSYVGVGLTAYIGKRLTEADLNPVNEKWLVVKYLLKFGHITLKIDDTGWQRYSNLIVANIDRMSKIIQLSDKSKVDDGQAELYTTPQQSLLGTARILVKGVVFGLVPARRISSVRFISKRSGELQCDGEVFAFDKGSQVSVEIHHKRLKTLA